MILETMLNFDDFAGFGVLRSMVEFDGFEDDAGF